MDFWHAISHVAMYPQRFKKLLNCAKNLRAKNHQFFLLQDNCDFNFAVKYEAYINKVWEHNTGACGQLPFYFFFFLIGIHSILRYSYRIRYIRIQICDALRDLVPFVQFKQREQHPWRSVTFSKVSDFHSELTFLENRRYLNLLKDFITWWKIQFKVKWITTLTKINFNFNFDGDTTEPSIQSQDTPTKYFTASETEHYGNEFLAFKNTLWRS